MDKVLSTLPNDKPGRYLLTGLWIKKFHSMKGILNENLIKMFSTEVDPPESLITSKTTVLAKNEETENPMTCRRIALQNCIFKVYTAVLADFITDHCEQNTIITLEQAAGKRGT